MSIIRIIKTIFWTNKGKNPWNYTQNLIGMNKGKKKGIPVDFWTGPEESRRMKIPDFKTIGA